MSRSSDGRLEVKLSRPAARAPAPTRTAFAALVRVLDSAMEFAARTEDYAAGRSRGRRRDRSRSRRGAFSLAARLYVSLPGMERATAQRLVEAAHQVCPYSRATHGNIASKRRWSEADTPWR